MQNFIDGLEGLTEYTGFGILELYFLLGVIGCLVFELVRRWRGYEPFFPLEEKELPLPHTISMMIFLLLLYFSANFLG